MLFENVTVRFGGPNPTLAVSGFQLDIAHNEFVALLGPSGCGKSTLLRVAAGLLGATSGRVVLEGEEVREPLPKSVLVFQDYGRSLLPWRSVWKNVALGIRHSRGGSLRERALHYLDMVSLSDAANKFPWQLSGGMQQRVAFARALANEPQVLLMDEPLGSLDAFAREQLQDILLDLWKRLSLTIVFVTHDVDEAAYLATRIVVMTHAPGSVGDQFQSALPSDREQDTTRASAEFRDLRLRVRRALHSTAGHE